MSFPLVAREGGEASASDSRLRGNERNQSSTAFCLPRREQAGADDDGERDQAGRNGERQTDRGDGGGGSPADGGKRFGEGGDARGDLPAAELAALRLRAEPELDRGGAAQPR